MSYTEKTQKAIEQFGLNVCLEAYRLNLIDGEGCSMISYEFECLEESRTKAGQAIDAGREVSENSKINKITIDLNADELDILMSALSNLHRMASKSNCDLIDKINNGKDLNSEVKFQYNYQMDQLKIKMKKLINLGNKISPVI